jgi:O-antigen/teichoic acid export membrane protein
VSVDAGAVAVTVPRKAASPGLFGRVARGVGAMSVGALVKICGQLAIVPVAMAAWGEARYGEWLVLAGLVTFLSLADLGLQSFVVNRMCASYARGDRDEVHQALHSSLRVQLPIALGVLALLSLALVLVPLDRTLELRTVGRGAVSAVALLLAAELLAGVPMGVIAGLYRATGRLPRAALIAACQQAALLGATVGLVALRQPFTAVAAARVTVAVVFTGVVLWDLKRLLPWLRLWPSSGSARAGFAMIGSGVYFLVIPLADYLSSQVSLLILQGAGDGGAVSHYSTHRTLVNVALMVSGMLTVSIWPELTALHARGHAEGLRRVQGTLTRFNVWLVGGITLGMLPLLPYLYPAWTAGRLRLDLVVAVLLIARVLVWAAWNSAMTVLLSTNRHERVAFTQLGAAAVGVVAALVLVPAWGIRGAAAAALAGDLAVSAWLVPVLAARETGVPPLRFWRGAGGDMAAGVALPALAGAAAWVLVPWPLPRVAAALGAGAAVAVPLAWRRLSDEERGVLRRVARRVRPG